MSQKNTEFTEEELKMYFMMVLSRYMTEHRISHEDMHFLLPKAFLTYDDYDTKNRILVEALNNNILIEETKGFAQIVEEVSDRNSAAEGMPGRNSVVPAPRRVSILGDSVSTFQGYNPPDYYVYYADYYRSVNGLRDVSDTWWHRVIKELNAELCVNNSFSGSRCSGKEFPAACCAERLDHLRTPEKEPDIILVYIGFNDYGYGVRPKGKKFLFRKPDLLIFEDAYNEMLSGIKKRYPDASVFCGTLMKTRIRGEADWVFPQRYGGEFIGEYNDVIRLACRKHQCGLADLDSLNRSLETLDGSHPTAVGHREFADAWLCFLK